MTQNPILNALAAAAYIIVIVLIINFVVPKGPDDPIFAPIVALSLFTLSAAVMGYLFVFQPLRMYIDGQKQAAVKLFLQTIAVFAGLTVFALLMMFIRK